MDETSQPIELLVTVKRDGSQTLGAQVEDQLRDAIRAGVLRSGARVPSTRDLARQLGVSRRIAVDAYSQLAAEGYLVLRQGARPHVSDAAAVPEPSEADAVRPALPPRYDFRPSMPDVSTFPRTAWLRSLRHAVTTITDADLGYGDMQGKDQLRAALADYLGRVRGVVAAPAQVVITCGYGQGLGIACRALAAGGARRIACEDPCNPEQRDVVAATGLEPVPVGVDEDGVKIDELRDSDADAVLLTPAHQHPTGVLLASDRRTALLAWLRERDAIAVEDDYDAEYRYDRAAVGALQGLDPDRVIYAGSASKTLAPALRLGWMVVPARLRESVAAEKVRADMGTARIEQLALADFIARGELDRHLRRMRVRYRARRDALLDALADALPEATVRGMAAGLHATVELPQDDDEQAIREEAGRRRIEIDTMAEYFAVPRGGPPTLLLGFGQVPEPAIRAGIGELAEAVSISRAAGSS